MPVHDANDDIARDGAGVRSAHWLWRADEIVRGRANATVLATVSHELRAPLNAIICYADLLQLEAGAQRTERAAGYVDSTRATALHQRQLIEATLSFSSLDAKRKTVTGGTLLCP